MTVGDGQVFSGVRVVEIAQGMSGPLAGMVLADNGADVIKLERPAGDWARVLPGFAMWNRGKRSRVVDLHAEAGVASVHELLASADVLICDLGADVRRRVGLDEATLTDRYPRLVHVAISAFGELRQFESVAGYEAIVAARSGRCMGNDVLSGKIPDTAAAQPIYLAAPISSYGASMLALAGISAGLFERERSGRGQGVRTSLIDGTSAATMRLPYRREGDRIVPAPAIADRALLLRGIALTFMTARCSDSRYIQMCARQDHHFRSWMRALGIEAVMDEERYAKAPLGFRSMADIDELEARIREIMQTRSVEEWMEVFDRFDVPGDPFLTPDEFLVHPQMVENDRIVELDDPERGVVRQVGALALFERTPSHITTPAPRLGEHSDATFDVAARPSGGAGSAAGSGSEPPFTGVTILEFATYLAAPIGATVMAELGARVIKIEPVGGDSFRRAGLESVHLLHGKESIVVDLKTTEGQQLVYRLVEQADAVLHNFRPGVVERLGIDPATLAAINPRLVYLYAGSYGSKGPQSHRAAFHSTPNALNGGGIAQAGEGNPPVDDSYPDPCAGLAVGATLAMAILEARRSGRGQYVETTMLCSNGYVHSNDLTRFAGAPGPLVSDHRQRGPHALYRLYECTDGWVFLACIQDDEFVALAAATGNESWLEDDRLATAAGRWANGAALAPALERYFSSASVAEHEGTLGAAGVPVSSAAHTNLEAFLAEVGLLSAADHPAFGEYWRLPPPVRFSRSEPRRGRASAVGEHSTALLAELGLDAEEQYKLLEAGVVRSA